tara:strand:+ start:19598 stop:20131 length:534 start_codon:yes stop_codon:yes gene_type:complete
MRINFDRLSQLAGLPTNGNRKSLYEGADHDHKMEMDHGHSMEEEREDEDYKYEGSALSGVMEEDEDDEPMSEPKAKKEMMDPKLDEMIEVDEVMLVQELRRAKKIMQESKRRKLNESRKRNMLEAQLKQVIDEEVQNVMDEMNLTAGWVYGDRRPRNSKKGYTNQGSMLPGIGFRRR